MKVQREGILGLAAIGVVLRKALVAEGSVGVHSVTVTRAEFRCRSRTVVHSSQIRLVHRTCFS